MPLVGIPVLPPPSERLPRSEEMYPAGDERNPAPAGGGPRSQGTQKRRLLTTGGVNQQISPPCRHSNSPESPSSASTLHTAVGTGCPNLGRAMAGAEKITNTAATNTATARTLTMRFNAPPPCLRTLRRAERLHPNLAKARGRRYHERPFSRGAAAVAFRRAL
jgi:hypothetical protein